MAGAFQQPVNRGDGPLTAIKKAVDHVLTAIRPRFPCLEQTYKVLGVEQVGRYLDINLHHLVGTNDYDTMTGLVFNTSICTKYSCFIRIMVFEPDSSLVVRWVSMFMFCHNLAASISKRLLKTSGVFKPLRVLHLSDNFIVINKDPDVLINSNDPKVTSSLHVSLCHEFPRLANPLLRHSFHFVHRLDYVTSGVIVIGLSKRASSAAAAAFENRLASKYYVALLRGHVSAELIEINLSIGELKSEITGSHRMTILDDRETCVSPRPAITRLLVLERGIFDGYPATKVILKPITGRRHQLRVHCAHIGHTIVGDFTYSCRRDINPERTFLHALRLTLPNSVESLDIQTADPFGSINGWFVVEKCNDISDSAFMRLQTNSEVTDSVLKIS